MKIKVVRQPSVLIIAFIRKKNVIQLLECCARNGVTKVYLAVDGPRNNEEIKIQNSLIAEAKAFSLSRKIDLKLWHRSDNLGVAVGVISAIDWFFKYENKGVILEDDLEPSDHVCTLFIIFTAASILIDNLSLCLFFDLRRKSISDPYIGRKK